MKKNQSQQDLTLPYLQRASNVSNPAATRLLRLMDEKQTNLIFAADVTKASDFLKLVRKVGKYIAVLKTHADMIEGFSRETSKEIGQIAEEENFMIFEDRKFGDIGGVVMQQYAGGNIRIADWAHFVTVHAVPGPGIIDSLGKVIAERQTNENPRGILVLAQMSTKDTFATGKYTERAVEIAKREPQFVAGFIGSGNSPVQVRQLRVLAGQNFLILTPGVHISSTKGVINQLYNTPESAVKAGSDAIIVGTGIYRSDDPEEEAKLYRDAAWNAYLEKVSKER